MVRRFGPAALVRVRARLAPPLDQLAAVLTSRDWVPVRAQVVVTEAIADELLDRNLGALYPLLVEDTRAGLGRLELALVRGMGPARALKLGPKSFAKVYEHGACDVTVDGRRAELTFRGSPLFGHPTWRLMQLLAQRVLLELAGSPGAAVGHDHPGTADGFRVIATW